VKTQNSFVSKEDSSVTAMDSLLHITLSCGRPGIHLQDLDCWDSHFPTHKGPKYLQYSNSLNNTSIFHFIQLFSAMSSMFHHIYIHSYIQTGTFHCFEVFLYPFLLPDSYIIVIISPVVLGHCPRPSMGLSGIFITKQSKKQYVSETN
jgi:hypothetical protein